MDLYRLVTAFLHEVEICLALLRLDFSRVDRSRLVLDDGSVMNGGLLAFPQAGGEGVRSGIVGDDIHFSLHGNGCLFELANGADIDIDWDAHGHPMFDVWRLNSYARSVNQPTEWTAEELAEAAAGLVRDGVLERRGGFYVALHTQGRGEV